MAKRTRGAGLLERLEAGPVICAEGYLFELERRGYLQAGAYVPEVVLDHPEMVRQLHREFVHAGSDVVEAFTYYGHREKLKVIGKEDDPGAAQPSGAGDRQGGGGRERRAARRQPVQHQHLRGGRRGIPHPGAPGVRGAGRLGARRQRRLHHRRDHQLARRGDARARDHPGLGQARRDHARDAPGRRHARGGADARGMQAPRGRRRRRGRAELLARAGDHAAGDRADPQSRVLPCRGAAGALPHDARAADLPVAQRPGLPLPARTAGRSRWPSIRSPATATRSPSSPQPRMPWTCATLASAAAPVRTTSAPWPRRSAATRRPAATRPTCRGTRFSGPIPSSRRATRKWPPTCEAERSRQQIGDAGETKTSRPQVEAAV